MSINPQVNLPPMGTSSVYSSNQVQELGSVQELRWSASIANPFLIAWQDAPGARNTYAAIPDIQHPTCKPTTGPSIGGLNLADTPVFYLNFYDNTDNNNIWQNHHANITVPVISSSSRSSPTTPTSFSAKSSTTQAFSFLTTTQPADPNSILAIISTAVPSSAIADPAAQCFLHNTPFRPQNTTPAWYTALPTPAQSYLVSPNAHNTAACTVAPSSSSPASPSSTSHPSIATGGLSTGAKAGIGVGAGIGGIAAIAGLVGWWGGRGEGRGRRGH